VPPVQRCVTSSAGRSTASTAPGGAYGRVADERGRERPRGSDLTVGQEHMGGGSVALHTAFRPQTFDLLVLHRPASK